MKLLFDENLSFRLACILQDIYPDSIHVREIGLLGSEDKNIWEFAAGHDFILASKDADFYQRSLLYGAPPKVIWLRVGNAPTLNIAALLRERFIPIRRFAEDEDSSFLTLRLV